MNEPARTHSAAPSDDAAVKTERSGMRHLRRFLICLTTLFVFAGIAAIVYLLGVRMPRDNLRQAVREFVPALQSAQEGDTLCFGAYEQDDDPGNGAEPIEWIVLEKQSDCLLLISLYALDCMPFNTSESLVTWDRSSILHWLNDTFYDDAFNDAEKTLVCTTVLEPDRNPLFSTDPGKVTQERVFLLSIVQAEHYFVNEQERLCSATAYAKSRGVRTDNLNGSCVWWLRTPGYDASAAARILSDGRVNYCGYPNHVAYAVRPCIRVLSEPVVQ